MPDYSISKIIDYVKSFKPTLPEGGDYRSLEDLEDDINFEIPTYEAYKNFDQKKKEELNKKFGDGAILKRVFLLTAVMAIQYEDKAFDHDDKYKTRDFNIADLKDPPDLTTLQALDATVRTSLESDLNEENKKRTALSIEADKLLKDFNNNVPDLLKKFNYRGSIYNTIAESAPEPLKGELKKVLKNMFEIKKDLEAIKNSDPPSKESFTSEKSKALLQECTKKIAELKSDKVLPRLKQIEQQVLHIESQLNDSDTKFQKEYNAEVSLGRRAYDVVLGYTKAFFNYPVSRYRAAKDSGWGPVGASLIAVAKSVGMIVAIAAVISLVVLVGTATGGTGHVILLTGAALYASGGVAAAYSAFSAWANGKKEVQTVKDTYKKDMQRKHNKNQEKLIGKLWEEFKKQPDASSLAAKKAAAATPTEKKTTASEAKKAAATPKTDVEATLSARIGALQKSVQNGTEQTVKDGAKKQPQAVAQAFKDAGAAATAARQKEGELQAKSIDPSVVAKAAEQFVAKIDTLINTIKSGSKPESGLEQVVQVKVNEEAPNKTEFALQRKDGKKDISHCDVDASNGKMVATLSSNSEDSSFITFCHLYKDFTPLTLDPPCKDPAIAIKVVEAAKLTGIDIRIGPEDVKTILEASPESATHFKMVTADSLSSEDFRAAVESDPSRKFGEPLPVLGKKKGKGLSI